MKLRFGFNHKRNTMSFPDIPFDVTPTKIRHRLTNTSDWIEVIGTAMNVPDTDRVVHTVEIEGLSPDTSYEFQTSVSAKDVYLTWKNDPTNSIVIHWQTLKPFTKRYTGSFYTSVTHKFKTIPATLNTEQFQAAQISDTHGGGDYMKDVYTRIGQHPNIRVVFHSGDMATGNGGEASPSTWYSFFDALNSLKDSQGHIIPLLPALGNHEVWGGYSGIQYADNAGYKPNFETGERGDAEWYYCFFPSFLETGYAKHDCGDYLTIWQIDPGITTKMDEGQDVWLDDTMMARENVPTKIVSLHYNPWTAGRRVMFGLNTLTRQILAPIWEKYQPLVFTGHDHVWSISPPIKGGAIDQPAIDYEEGTYYLGAGTANTGVQAGRNPHTKWWIEDSIATVWQKFDFEDSGLEQREAHPDDGTTFDWQEGSHYWLVTCDYNQKTMTAYNSYNEVIHSFTLQS